MGGGAGLAPSASSAERARRRREPHSKKPFGRLHDRGQWQRPPGEGCDAAARPRAPLRRPERAAGKTSLPQLPEPSSTTQGETSREQRSGSDLRKKLRPSGAAARAATTRGESQDHHHLESAGITGRRRSRTGRPCALSRRVAGSADHAHPGVRPHHGSPKTSRCWPLPLRWALASTPTAGQQTPPVVRGWTRPEGSGAASRRAGGFHAPIRRDLVADPNDQRFSSDSSSGRASSASMIGMPSRMG